MYNLLTEENLFKVGFTVSKRVGNAVKRNRCKRLIRAAIREAVRENVFNSMEVIIIAKPALLEQRFNNFKIELIKGLRNLR